MKLSVFIAGGTDDAGQAIAERFAREGYAVFIGDRDGEGARQLAERLTERYRACARGFQLKTLDEENLYRVFHEIRRLGYALSCLVLNEAEPGLGQSLFRTTTAEFMSVLQTNLGWNFILVRQAAAQMKQQGGSIVFVNAGPSACNAPNHLAYVAVQSGQLGLVQALAQELGQYRIRVNAVVTGTAAPEEEKKPLRNFPEGNAVWRHAAAPADVANAVFYLGGQSSASVTGAELPVDCGRTRFFTTPGERAGY